jgi:hypothetical protein
MTPWATTKNEIFVLQEWALAAMACSRSAPAGHLIKGNMAAMMTYLNLFYW